MRLDTMVVALAMTAAACGSPDASNGAARGEAASAEAPARAALPDADGDGRADAGARPRVGTPAASRGAGAGDAAGTSARGAAGAAPGTGGRGAAAPGDAGPTAGEPADADAGGANEILRRAERAYSGVRSMRADFVQLVTVPLLEETRRSRGRIYHRRPDRFLMDFSDPEGDVIVADGRYLWMYYPSTDARQVLRTTLDGAGGSVDLQREFLYDATSRYSARHLGAETVGGRPADVLRLTPREPSQYRQVKIWVDRGDSMVRRFEIVEQNGSVRRLELSDLAPNVALGDELFTFEPPPGAEVFDS